MSTSIVNISKALLEAQKQMGAVLKDSRNPFFKSNYATLNAVREASNPQLNAAGISVLQPTVHLEGKSFVRTLLLHESGEYLGSDTEIVCAKVNDPQATGSAISYARRYGLSSMLGLSAADDDGEAAVDRSPKKTKSPDAPKFDTKSPTIGIVSLEPSVGTTQTIPDTLTNTSTKTNSWRKPKPTTTASDDGMEFG